MEDFSYYVKNLRVFYEDNHVMVVEKFQNILSQKDETTDFSMVEIVKEYIKEKYSKPGNVYLGLIHRFDRRVGGVMVFAKTSKAASRLSEDIRNHKFNKYYIAKVYGCLPSDGEINLKLEKTKDNLAIVSENGKDASLSYHVLKNSDEESVVEIKLITGRYNQIRASFAYIGHPVYNDYKYSKIFTKNNSEIGLYCYKVVFAHPVTKESIEIKNMPNTPIWQ